MGFLLALIPAIAWGSIGLVSGKLGWQCLSANFGDDVWRAGFRDRHVDCHASGLRY